mgnify:CR=1 FL=1
MPSRDYKEGFAAGWAHALDRYRPTHGYEEEEWIEETRSYGDAKRAAGIRKKPKRKQKPSAWNKFVKANSKKKKFIYQSGANKGKLNLKKMGVAWRKTAAGKKKR